MTTEGCYEFRPNVEKIIRNGEFVLRDRRDWLPDAERQIGRGFFDDGKKGVVYLKRDGRFQMICLDIVHFLSVPEERVFDRVEDELYFCLLNRRTWYLFLEDGVFYARYSK